MSETHSSPQHCPTCGKAQPRTHRFCEQCGEQLHMPASGSDTSADSLSSRESMLNQIRGEIEELKSIAAAFGVERIRDGSWFNEFIQAMLKTYARRIIAGGGIEFFRSKYPGLTRDQIAEKLCDLATRYAALAGGASGTTASTAFSATIGTAGGADVIAVPAGVAAIVAEMFYTTRLQLRLVYDLSAIYGYPIDVEDPEDLYKAFCMAYGVTFAAGNAGLAVKAAAPEVARAQIRGLINGQTAAIQQVAIRLLGPKIGRQITQRAILRAAVPVVGIGISATWNYVATNSIATSARYGLRAIGRLRDAVADVAQVLKARPDDVALVLESMLSLITSDGRFDRYEQEVFNCVVRQLNITPEALERIEQRVDSNTSSTEQSLRSIEAQELRTTLITCLQLVAVANGEVVDSEVELLHRYMAALGQPLDLEQLRAQAGLFQPPTSWAQRAGESMGTIGSSVGATVSGWFTKRAKNHAAPPQAIPDEDVPEPNGPLEQIRALAALHVDGILSDIEFQAKKQELLARL